VHADRAVDLALPAEQRAQREVQVDRLRIDLDHLDERLDGLVRLLVQQEVEAAEIRQRQGARLAQQVLDVDARGDPAHREEQPPGSAAATRARSRPCAYGRPRARSRGPTPARRPASRRAARARRPGARVVAAHAASWRGAVARTFIAPARSRTRRRTRTR
jgi:hypothetical protein